MNRGRLGLERGTTNADVTAGARPAGEARPLGIAKHSTTTESDIAVHFGEVGPSWPIEKSTPSAVVTAVVNSADAGFAKHSDTTQPEVAETSGEGEAGSSWSRTTCTTSATATTATKSVGDGEARPPGIAKSLVTAKSDLAESSGGAGPS